METAVIVAAKRTAIGAFGKAFKDVPTATLGATAVRAALEEVRYPGAAMSTML